MKRIIRHSVFETNSSSSHSITVCTKGGDLDTVTMDRKEIVVCTGEFGWEDEQYNDFQTKLSYLATYVANKFGIIGTLVITRDNAAKYKFDNVFAAFDLVNENKLKIIKISNEFEGYIDHQSTHVAKNILESDAITIANYLFCEDSYLKTDNDNHQ